jgi:KipI family sensor histidine kinase inhibitor
VRPRISRLGEETWLVEFEPRLDPAINDRVLALARAIELEQIAGILDVGPAAAMLAVHVDANRLDEEQFEPMLRRLLDAPAARAMVSAGTMHEVPVCYEAPHAPDLEEVAAWSGCSASEVVARHSGVEYRVFMIGFLPGFPYLGPVDPRIAAPRRDVPRVKVPAGSVGIAGLQTGIYPSESPGGWRIIGRTPMRLFDVGRPSPATMRAGDRVRFVPIGAGEFEQAREADEVPRP